MYNNIGKKIKRLAIAMFVIEAIGGIATGITMGMSGGDTIVATVITIASPFVAWVSSWVTYGFGVLVDNSAIIAENTAPTRVTINQTVKAQPVQGSTPKANTNQTSLNSVYDLYKKGLITKEEYQRVINKPTK